MYYYFPSSSITTVHAAGALFATRASCSACSKEEKEVKNGVVVSSGEFEKLVMVVIQGKVAYHLAYGTCVLQVHFTLRHSTPPKSSYHRHRSSPICVNTFQSQSKHPNCWWGSGEWGGQWCCNMQPRQQWAMVDGGKGHLDSHFSYLFLLFFLILLPCAMQHCWVQCACH